ncbi:hypothetical protein KC887_03485 [Candidatus Kaiserbacteria bacterium]|nr:hypothetical protein [Candidatus Kaiserbacteria bacterium]
MNFLELCKRLHMEAGYQGAGPASVENQTGQAARLVTWIAEAWRDIQNLRDDWEFMANEFSVSLLSGENAVLLPADAARVRKDTPVILTSGQRFYPTELEIAGMRALERNHTSANALPAYYAFNQVNHSLRVYPATDRDITVNGEYFTQPQMLLLNTDIPALPERFHMLIVWGAMQYLSTFDEAGNQYQAANAKYSELISELTRSQLPVMTLAGPLA